MIHAINYEAVKREVFSPTGLVLGMAYANAPVDTLLDVSRVLGIPRWRIEKALTRLSRQGNVTVTDSRLYISTRAHPGAWRIGQAVARKLGIAGELA